MRWVGRVYLGEMEVVWRFSLSKRAVELLRQSKEAKNEEDMRELMVRILISDR